MKVLPVLDIRDGRAVHARGGDRARYAELRSRWGRGADPVALVRAWRDHLGLAEVYLADLDAIEGAEPALPVYDAIRDLGVSLWVDAGVRDRASLSGLTRSGIETIVVGLETIAGWEAFAEVAAELGRSMVFSLDLRDGRPLHGFHDTHEPADLATLAIDAGCRRVLLLDLARVGTGRGTGSASLLGELKANWPEVAVAVGGGVAGFSELMTIRSMGVSAVLVGSALHDGRIGLREIEACQSGPGDGLGHEDGAK